MKLSRNAKLEVIMGGARGGVLLVYIDICVCLYEIVWCITFLSVAGP